MEGSYTALSEIYKCPSGDMVIEVGGVWLLAEILGLQDMFAKFCTQFIVLALNYIFSKFIIFTTGKRIGGSK